MRYSYLVKYNGLFASLRLSNRGMSFKETTSMVTQLSSLRELSGIVEWGSLSVLAFRVFLALKSTYTHSHQSVTYFGIRI